MTAITGNTNKIEGPNHSKNHTKVVKSKEEKGVIKMQKINIYSIYEKIKSFAIFLASIAVIITGCVYVGQIINKTDTNKEEITILKTDYPNIKGQIGQIQGTVDSLKTLPDDMKKAAKQDELNKFNDETKANFEKISGEINRVRTEMATKEDVARIERLLEIIIKKK